MLQIHGSAFGHRNFERLTPELAGDFEIIDFDLPGFGESKGEPRPGGLEGIADQVAEFIHDPGRRTCPCARHLVRGHGGVCTWRRSTRQLIDRLVLKLLSGPLRRCGANDARHLETRGPRTAAWPRWPI